MTPPRKIKTAPKVRVIILTLITSLLIIALAMVGSRFLASKAEGPKRRHATKRPRAVSVIVIKKRPYTVHVQAHTVAKAAHFLTLRSRVSGTVVEAHKSLRPGGFIAKGETLLAIDPRELNANAERLSPKGIRRRAKLAQC